MRVVETILPVIDGLEQALESGRSYLERQRADESFRPGLGDRLAYALGRRLPPPAPDPTPIAAWLDGLELVRERLLAVLAGEGVRPLDVLDRPFDPYRHVALALADPAAYPDAAPGVVVGEQRRGYLAGGGQVLRFAEVVVMPGQPTIIEPEPVAVQIDETAGSLLSEIANSPAPEAPDYESEA